MEFRALIRSDEDFLWEMLRLASHEPSMEAVRAQPDLRRYVAGWGREGDFGIGAFEVNANIGAAWCRCWTPEDHGYGYVAPDIPELAVAVVPEQRGEGVGTGLIQRILVVARENYAAVSLSVRAGSRAEALYLRLGFVAVEGTEVTNRVGGTSYVMLLRF